jgi:predicted nucleic acid-binding protein
VGLIVLDAGVVIAVLDARDVHHPAAVKALSDAQDLGNELVLPVSAYAECLVSPSRSGPAPVATVDRFLDMLPARVEPATRAIGAVAASLRATYGPALRLPDALVVATAVVLEADRVVTTDARWPVVPVRVEVIAAAELRPRTAR